jgi:hypothetical protein
MCSIVEHHGGQLYRRYRYSQGELRLSTTSLFTSLECNKKLPDSNQGDTESLGKFSRRYQEHLGALKNLGGPIT